jgi:hypothetical protein
MGLEVFDGVLFSSLAVAVTAAVSLLALISSKKDGLEEVEV